MKEKTIKVTEKQEKLLKDALNDKKFVERLKISSPKEQNQRKEEAIDNIYELEKIEKQLN